MNPTTPLVSANDAVPADCPVSYADRLAHLHARKLEHTRVKRETGGPRDADDQGMIPLPPESSEVVEAISGSGVLVRDLILKGYEPESNHPSGGFFGAKSIGANFRCLLDAHPTYVDPASSMAGAYMVNFISYRKPGWNPDFDYSHLHSEQAKYAIDTGIGGVQHFCPDLSIGLALGWGGLLDNVRRHRSRNPASDDFYDGLESVILGMQDWIRRHSAEARRKAEEEENRTLRDNLLAIGAGCDHLASHPPRTFREVCQWLVFFQAGAKMFNGSGEWGQLDELLRPYFERDITEGRLSEEEAIFHIACLLLSETAYIQIGGLGPDGRDRQSRVSFLILEAVHRLKIPANITIRGGKEVSRELFRRGVEIQFEDRMGFPKFLGDRSITEGFMRSGYPIELARERTYSGCHWLGIPGREYTMADLIKIDLAWIFDLSFREMMTEPDTEPGIDALWARFERHLSRAVAVTAAGIDVHMRHMHEVFPELYLDLFCHGPVEKGLDITNGGVEFVNIGVDASSLATAADSFAALEERVVNEGRLSWREVAACLDSDWAGVNGERARRMMASIRRFGSGGSTADEWALRLSQTFSRFVTESTTPDGHRMIPGLFTWAKVVPFGKRLRATPNGRRAGAPVSHGPNPEPGFNEGRPGTPTQLAAAVATVEPGLGNTAPLQLDLDPGVGDDKEGLSRVEALLWTFFDLGGTLVNLNVMNRDTILAARDDPNRFPDLVVRVTGFSAYFASLSTELRQYIVDRIVTE